MAASPYGFWTSPITSDLVVADAIRLEQVALEGEAIYWSETQPQKQGRTFVYRAGADGEPERVTPDDATALSVRSRVHEYGGGAFAVSDDVAYFSNNRDQRLYRQDEGLPPGPITPVPPASLRTRCVMRMASSTAAGITWFASERITAVQVRRSRRWSTSTSPA